MAETVQLQNSGHICFYCVILKGALTSCPLFGGVTGDTFENFLDFKLTACYKQALAPNSKCEVCASNMAVQDQAKWMPVAMKEIGQIFA